LRKVIERMDEPRFPITLDYPVHPRPRYGYGKPPHALLLQIIEARRAVYASLLASFLPYKRDIWRIDDAMGEDLKVPIWVNDFLPGLDAVSLYCLIRLHRPRLYVEIGSGYSTRFARRAIADERLNTKIISVDPHPRIALRNVADQVVEQPVEEMPLEIFESLQSGDILFVDHSHRAFTNSDATVVFLDILPRLNPGVLVHFHDIFLPADYPPQWNERYYSEQYLLACHLLGHTRSFEILLANAFVTTDAQLSSLLLDLWHHPAMKSVTRHGVSFWVRMGEPRALA